MDNQPNDASPLRVALDDAGLGVKAAARHMGYARSTVHRWVTGDNDPRWSSFRHLRNVLALDESELFTLYSQHLAWSRRRNTDTAKAAR